ncbi:MAG: ComEC/Rec2 family competence protein [Candidatus Curtissbacteria bacterium]|nr:ComEC/Rec2 family competence protein [Candidatus Curtissbacteria bacterium]
MTSRQLPLYALTILFLLSAFFIRIKWQKPLETLPKNQKITFVATLKKEPKISDKYQVLTIADAKIYAPLFPSWGIGDRLQISGKIDEKGRVFYPQIEKTGEEKSLFGFLQSFRTRISQNLARLLPSREAALLQGTVLGVDNIEKDFKDQLIKTGTIHVVVVSGQNMAIVAGIFVAFAKYIGRRKALVLACVAVILYAAIAGFSAPVMRALIMVLVGTVAVYIGREAWPIWSLTFAALVIIFISPGALSEVSFQLTFAASLGIMTLGKVLTRVFARVPILGENAAIATSAYLFTAPVILFYFGRVSPIAPLVNILVAEAVFPIMVLGFLTAFASLIFMPLAQVLAYFAYVPAFYFVKVVEVFAK